MAINIAGSLTGVIEGILQILLYLGVVAAVVVGSWFFWRYRAYRYKCLIYTKRAEGLSSLSRDRGAFIKLAGDTWIFKLLKNRNATIKPVDTKFIWKVGKDDVIHFRNLGENQYIPFNPTFETDEEEEYLMKVNYDENLSWYLGIIDFIKSKLDWKTFWDKYGHYVIILTLVMFTIIVIYLNFKFVSAEFSKAKSIAAAIDRFIQSSGALGGGEVAP